MNITPELKDRVREIISCGLIVGIGKPNPGELCIEAAIALAMGERHSDRPSCVAEPDRKYAIRINDARWASDQERATALLPLALAQLGTAGTGRSPWVRRIVKGTIRRVVPIWLRHAANKLDVKHTDHATALRSVADRCANKGTIEVAREAKNIAYAAAASAAYAYASAASATSAASAAFAADVAFAAYAADVADVAFAAAATDAASAADVRTTALRESVAVALEAYAAEGRTP